MKAVAIRRGTVAKDLRGFVWSLWAGLLVWLCFTQVAHAQYWEARKILSEVPQSNVALQYKGETLETIPKSWVESYVAVADQIGTTYGMRVTTLVVNRDNEPNAFVSLDKEGVPFMVINTEMLRITGGDRNLLAAVVGHEYGHLHAQHLTRGQNRDIIISLLGIVAGAALDIHEARQGRDTHGGGMQLGQAGAGLVNAKFSRDQEREADDLGIRHMAAAGYDVAAPARLWEMMEGQDGGASGLWFSSHPSSAERLQAMRTLAGTLAQEIPQVTDNYPVSKYKTMEPTAEEREAGEMSVYARAWSAYKEKRYVDAIRDARQAAAAGDERALALLGDFQKNGQGQPQDLEGARASYQSAVEKGFPAAMVSLGFMNYQGSGIPQNYEEAARWFAIAHQRGLPRGTMGLCVLVEAGAGRPKDLVLARALAARATAQNDAFGVAIFAAYLRDGVGGPSDTKRSFALLQSSAGAGNAFAKYQLGLSYENGRGAEKSKDLAIAAYREAAAGGVPAAKKRLQALGVSQ